MSIGKTMNARSSQVKNNTRPRSSGTMHQQQQEEDGLLVTPPSRHLSVGTVGGGANPPQRSCKPVNKVTATATQPFKKTTKTTVKSKDKGMPVEKDKIPTATTTKSSNTSSNMDKKGSSHSKRKSMAAVYVEEQQQQQHQKSAVEPATPTTLDTVIKWPESNSKTTKKPVSPQNRKEKGISPYKETPGPSSLSSASSSGAAAAAVVASPPSKKSSTPAKIADASAGKKSKTNKAQTTKSSPGVKDSIDKDGDKKPAAVPSLKTIKADNSKRDNVKKPAAIAQTTKSSPGVKNNVVKDGDKKPAALPSVKRIKGDNSKRENVKKPAAVASSKIPTATSTASQLSQVNDPPGSKSKEVKQSAMTPQSIDPVKAEILAQEADLKNLAQQSGMAKSQKGAKKQPSEPGAYHITGQSIDRATSGVLSPQNTATSKQQQQQQSRTSANSRNSTSLPSFERSCTLLAPPDRTATAAERETGMIIAAELSSDAEAQIEEQVRQRILQEATRAEVVSVNHDTAIKDMNPEELLAYKELHKPKGVLEKLFGDTRPSSDIDISASPECIRTRDVLKWTLKRNAATNEWVASINTDQTALEQGDPVEIQKALRSFVAPTQSEAHATGLAMAVPRMLPFEENPICHVCNAKFALLRRPCHCRNCGVCICSACATPWSVKRLPDTFKRKNETTQVNVCIACDWLSSTFREALEQGKYKAALNLYKTGNVNLQMPFNSVKSEEVVYPIHVAVIGGNVDIVKWLAGERWCPVRGNFKTKRISKSKGKTDAPLMTSKGRSPLGIALSDQKLDIVHYLVSEKNMSFFEEKDMSNATALANFTSLLRMVPGNFFDGKTMERTLVPITSSSSTSSFSGSLHSVPAKVNNETLNKPVSDSGHSRSSTACSTISERSSSFPC